jgi:gluconolactonase
MHKLFHASSTMRRLTLHFFASILWVVPLIAQDAEPVLNDKNTQEKHTFFGRTKKEKHVFPTMGQVERLDPAFDNLIAPGTEIEKLASGFDWAEGPVWVKKGNYLLFSDVPLNGIYKWEEGIGTREYLFPSGYTGSTARGGEPGSNGLTIDKQGRLVLCQHGDRQIGRMDSNFKITSLARYYKLRRFNSPNDLVYKSNGDLYFTDPPYGLLGKNEDPNKELNFNGVYRLKPNGEVTLLTRELTFPNGIAFSPDESLLYVAVSDPNHAVWMVYDVLEDGTLSSGRLFADITSLTKDKKGLPDGMKVDKNGNIWATGPGGILVFTPSGQHLGTINTGEATGNCTFGDDGSTLYITADMYLCRIKTLTKGQGF